MKNSFERVDNFIDRILGESGYNFLVHISRYVVSLVSMALLVICTAHFVANGSAWSVGVVRADLSNIVDALARFDSDCGIKNILPGMHSLQFLTLPYPAVDELAGFSLQNTQAWKGPYIKMIPVVGGHPYVLLIVEKGNFVVPAYGVQLPNGQCLGTNIVWDWQSDVGALMASDGVLSHQGEPLACRYVLGSVAVNQECNERSLLREFMTAFTVASLTPFHEA